MYNIGQWSLALYKVTIVFVHEVRWVTYLLLRCTNYYCDAIIIFDSNIIADCSSQSSSR